MASTWDKTGGIRQIRCTPLNAYAKNDKIYKNADNWNVSGTRLFNGTGRRRDLILVNVALRCEYPSRAVELFCDVTRYLDSRKLLHNSRRTPAGIKPATIAPGNVPRRRSVVAVSFDFTFTVGGMMGARPKRHSYVRTSL
jgi:hypothetical protein